MIIELIPIKPLSVKARMTEALFYTAAFSYFCWCKEFLCMQTYHVVFIHTSVWYTVHAFPVGGCSEQCAVYILTQASWST